MQEAYWFGETESVVLDGYECDDDVFERGIGLLGKPSKGVVLVYLVYYTMKRFLNKNKNKHNTKHYIYWDSKSLAASCLSYTLDYYYYFAKTKILSRWLWNSSNKWLEAIY